jgi:hypothetical protein
MDIELQSSVPPGLHASLERLVFFNRNQLQSQADIVRALDQFGVPRIVADPQGLHVALSACDDAQCLFAFLRERDGLELAGMLIYRRTSPEEVLVVHVAVSDRFSNSGRPGLGLIIKMLRAVRSSARRLRGVQRLRVLYRNGRQFGIRISGRAADAEQVPAALPKARAS